MKWKLLIMFSLIFFTQNYAKKEKTSISRIKPAFVYSDFFGTTTWTESQINAHRGLEYSLFSKNGTIADGLQSELEAESVIGQLAEINHDIIFVDSPELFKAMFDVAKKYPRAVFMGYGATNLKINVGSYWIKVFQAKYLAGMVAASKSKSKKIGYISSIPSSQVYREVNAFVLGAQKIDPNISILHIWTKKSRDNNLEKKAVKTLIEMDCDVITQSLDSPVLQEVADNNGVYTIGHNIQMIDYAPKYHLADIVLNWEVIYNDIIKQVAIGKWESKNIWYGIAEEAVNLNYSYANLSKKTESLIKETKTKLQKNEIKVFSGEIKNIVGEVVVKEGFYLVDASLLKMNWFVFGVKHIDILKIGS